jgi:hypothetical protein
MILFKTKLIKAGQSYQFEKKSIRRGSFFTQKTKLHFLKKQNNYICNTFSKKQTSTNEIASKKVCCQNK